MRNIDVANITVSALLIGHMYMMHTVRAASSIGFKFCVDPNGNAPWGQSCFLQSARFLQCAKVHERLNRLAVRKHCVIKANYKLTISRLGGTNHSKAVHVQCSCALRWRCVLCTDQLQSSACLQLHKASLRVLPQECDGIGDWESEYAELTLVDTVLADFCRYYGLSVAGTQLKHGQEFLNRSQELQRVRLSCQHVQEEMFRC